MRLTRFRSLVDEHQNRVFSFAFYFLADRAEAEDVTQEVLLRLWDHIDTVETESAGAWLSRVTRNACVDVIRRRKSHDRVIGPSLDTQVHDPVTSSLDDDPEGAVRSWDVQRHLRRALEQVDEPYRSIVILREVQGLKYTEISDLLEIPLNTVKTYLHRARRKLREHLQEVHCYAATS